MSTSTALATVKAQARKRIEKQLDQMESVFGPLDNDPELLGAVMDGAQEAVMEWIPQSLYHPQVTLIGGNVPKHRPGAYPNLSCCGGETKIVPLGDPRFPGEYVVIKEARNG